ncbi:MAG: murein L,D-transpeptidase catalytic domain family protein [Chitinophagaceae bacterium]|nr:murein L,D-transpeptidase catalytic domain family protein [Chitinophagaceae bacterium]
MKLSSGSNRFFVYDLKKDSILARGLVAHGSGSDNGGKELVFSNTISSYSTSLGKYKIGNSYDGKFGLAYKLHGLDKTNSNAFNRFVVLHSHSCIPQNEVAPLEICRSWGCPTVSPAFLSTLKMYLDKPGKPVLLQIFY